MFLVGVRFRPPGRCYWFDAGNLVLEVGDRVVAETAHGLALGTVRVAPRQAESDSPLLPVKPLVRKATPEDEEQYARNAAKVRTVMETTIQRITHFGLPMKVVAAEYALDGSMVTVFFTAEGRVDFRELVRDLASRLRTRVQLYQIGSRDHTRLLGGLGPCGRELCCRLFLMDFAPVSMRMAKDQSLLLSPAKFSGACGKLMCCLRFEHEVYTEARSRLPAPGERVETQRGTATVASVSPITETVTVTLDATGAEITVPAGSVRPMPPCSSAGNGSSPDTRNTPDSA